MPKKVDLTGQEFGKLTVIRKIDETDRGPNGIRWLCQCECGNTAKVPTKVLRFGDTKSCGCLKRTAAIRRCLRHGHALTGKKSRTYRIWMSMWTRCTRPKAINYKYYGGRGITVCDRWKSFDAFLEDMGEIPEGLSIDRIDNDIGYSPENCRLATPKEQMANLRPRK